LYNYTIERNSIKVIREYSYKFQIYPDSDQQVLLSKHFGCIRWVYNHFLDQRTKHYLDSKEKKLKKKSLNYFDNAKALTEIKHQPETDWLSECNSQSLQHALKNLDGAFNRFFKKLGKYPRFKKLNSKQSFRVPQFVKVEDGRLSFPKFNEGIRIDQHRHIEGEIKNATISKNQAGQYFACIGVQREIKLKPKTNKMVGVDLGIKTFAVCSDGKSYSNIKPFQSLERRIKLRSKELSRTQKDSKGRKKARRKLAKLHVKIANIRNDHLQKVSSKIVDENQVIVLESLNIKGMMANRKLSKSIWDCSWSEFVRQIEYKSKWYGRDIVRIDRFFPSSKTCNICGCINENLTLEDRKWTCSCGVHHDRDLNAARVILRQGQNLLNITTVGTTGIANCLGIRPDVKVRQLIELETHPSLAGG
jgi:putative transposase